MSNTRVFIGRLTHRARESDVERFFKGYGKLRDVSLKNGYGFVEFDDARDAEDAVYELNNREICGERVTIEHAKGTPRSGGGGGYRGGGDYGRRDSHRDSYRDSYRDRGYDRGGYGGQRRTNYYDSRAIGKRGGRTYGPPVRTKYRVIVENLSSRVSWQDLKDYLREAGEVTYADAHKHRQNEGVVDFATYDDMKRAIDKMDDTELNGRRIKLVPDGSFSSRSRSRSRSRGRSRSRSRSARRSRSRSKSRRSRSRSRSRGGSKSRSRSRSRSRRDSRSRSRSASRARSGSKSAARSRSRSRSNEKDDKKSRSRSRSAEDKRSKSRSRSRSPVEEKHENGDSSPKQQEGSEEKPMSRSPSPRE